MQKRPSHYILPTVGLKRVKPRVVRQNLGTGAFAKSEVPCVRLLCMANFALRPGLGDVAVFRVTSAGTGAE